MTSIEAIETRKSVRTYTGTPPSREIISEIKKIIDETPAPFNAKARVAMINVDSNGDKRIKLGTYGYIQGATDFLALIYEPSPFAEVGAAYMFEQIILQCTSLGLGTCWLGGSFSRKDFKSQINLAPNEILRIVSPIGYEKNKPRLIEKVLGLDKNHYSRKPFTETFFLKSFNRPLHPELAGKYTIPLEMVRLGPSANNKQSWRIIYDGDFHFYKTFSYGFSSIDIGIALCHFELTCIELGINGRYTHNDNITDSNYVMSWTEKTASN
jgi:nitroreductase